MRRIVQTVYSCPFPMRNRSKLSFPYSGLKHTTKNVYDHLLSDYLTRTNHGEIFGFYFLL